MECGWGRLEWEWGGLGELYGWLGWAALGWV